MSKEPKEYVNGRIVGGYSTFDREYPEKHTELVWIKHQWRVVDCCGVEDDRDIEECQICGRQISVPCSFDDDFS